MAATPTGIQAADWGFAPLQTLSGQSLGSLEQHSIDWNAADSVEVSSGGLPLGPGLLAQKMLVVKAAVQEADRVAEVKFIRLSFFVIALISHYPQSPRFGSSHRGSVE